VNNSTNSEGMSMSHTRYVDATRYEVHGFTMRSLASSDRGSSELAVWLIEAPAGVSGPPHTMTSEEVFVVRSGRLVATVDDKNTEIGPGDALIAPSGATFAMSNPFDEPAEAVACTRLGMTTTLNGQVMAPPWAA
jgi:mannose-6-phosphate isomerase-like protein (cupin superfamily)